MTVRNSSPPIARVFWATAAPGVERRLLAGEAEPGRAVSPRLKVVARRTVTCCQTTNADSC